MKNLKLFEEFRSRIPNVPASTIKNMSFKTFSSKVKKLVNSGDFEEAISYFAIYFQNINDDLAMKLVADRDLTEAMEKAMDFADSPYVPGGQTPEEIEKYREFVNQAKEIKQRLSAIKRDEGSHIESAKSTLKRMGF